MIDSIYTSISHCRICGEKQPNCFLELGKQPPANSLRDNREDPLPSVPLSVVRCDKCTTVQLKDTVKPEFIFRNYLWVTGTSPTTQSYSAFFCDEVLTRLPEDQLFIVEVASNDGTFLKCFKNAGHKVLGIDPAKNIACMAEQEGIPTLPEFFGKQFSESIVSEFGKADCVFARNVISHVEDVHDVISGMAHCIKNEGIAIIEFHYAGNILASLQYDSIYHEHLFYFSLESLCFLLESHGIWAFDCNESPMNGGSIALYCSKTKKPVSPALQEKLSLEKKTGLNLRSEWLEFAKKCFLHKKKLNSMVKALLSNEGKMIGYGASARSSTLLNFCGIDHRHLLCIGDGNPIKQGKYTAGTDIPIVTPDAAFAKKPDAILLLSWNFKDEILSIIKDKFHFHGKVIIPLPSTPYILEI